MSEKRKLKPCPFCGGTFLGVRHITNLIGEKYKYESYVFCHKCSARGTSAKVNSEMSEEGKTYFAEYNWNKRVEGEGLSQDADDEPDDIDSDLGFDPFMGQFTDEC